jgi:hypothetical protein
MNAVVEKPKYQTKWIIEKFKGDFKNREEALAKAKPYAVENIEGNLLLNEGINELWSLVCGTGGVKFDATNAYIGVGDSSTAAAATQTGLQAATNKLYKGMDSTYPTYGTDQKAVWRSTFGTSDANFAWEEITVANGNSDTADNLNRKCQAMGTKASGTTWIVTLEITLS